VERADIISRSSRYERIRVIIGNSLLTTDGADHHRRRRIIQPTFQPRHVRDYTAAMVSAADETDQAWRPGATVRMEQEMAALTMSAIGRAVLGLDGRQHAEPVGEARPHAEAPTWPTDRLPRARRCLVRQDHWSRRAR